MTRIRVTAVIPAPPAIVWADVRRLGSHVEWMDDAVEIRFSSTSTAGVGTSFTCVTKVGPFTVADHMVVTRWEDGRAIGIRHKGLVRGEGTFTLRALPGRGAESTSFTWEEQLQFPWRLGGPLGAAVGKPVLRRMWQHNLANLAARFR